MFFRASLPPAIFRRITSWDALPSITSDLDAPNLGSQKAESFSEKLIGNPERKRDMKMICYKYTI